MAIQNSAEQAELGLHFNPRQLKRARIKAGFTQKTLASAIGIHHLTLWHYETPTHYGYVPHPDKLRRIARLCKVTPQSFYEWPDTDPHPERNTDERS